MADLASNLATALSAGYEPNPNRLELRALEVLRSGDGEEGSAPEWIQLTQAEGTIECRDGRKTHIASAAKLVREYNRRVKADGVRASIDWDHSEHSFLRAMGGRSPAAAWIESLAVRDGQIWAQVDWTEDGRKDVEGRAYRYISPALAGTWKTKKVGTNDDGSVETEDIFHAEALLNAALVNSPALRMTALFAASAGAPGRTQPQEDTMSKVILAMLGLAETATEQDALLKIESLKAEASKVTTLQLKAEKAENRCKVLEAEKAEAGVTLAVDEATRAGKIAPAQRESMLKIARLDLAAFSEFIASAPVIGGSPTGLDNKQPPGTAKLSEAQKSDIRALRASGMASDEVMAKTYNVDLSEIQGVK